MSSAATFMSRKQFWSEEEMHASQRASTLTTKLKASGKDVHKILNASSACKGKRPYRNNLGLVQAHILLFIFVFSYYHPLNTF